MTSDRSDEKQPDKGPTPDSSFDWRQVAWLTLALVIVWAWLGSREASRVDEIPYTQFKEEVREGGVKEVVIRGERLTGTRFETQTPTATGTEDAPSGSKLQRFVTTLPAIEDPELMDLLEEHGVVVRAQPTSGPWWAEILLGVLPWVLLLGLLFYASYRMQRRLMGGDGAGGMFGFARSRARRVEKEESQVTYDDVAGLDNAKRDLREVVDFLKRPGRYRELGAKNPRGVLLMGPPGTGKTLLAKAVAGEADVPFFSVSASEFIEMLVGVGASRVRHMFADAKKEAPAVIFIDEIDAIGRTRGSGLGGGHDEREQTLNQILSEMDGFADNESVVVMAATNRPDVLDPALLRPGRFDRKITLELPRKPARLQILEVHTKDVPLGDDVDLEAVAGRTIGFSGADLANLVNEAAMLAARERSDRVRMGMFDQARDKITLGAEREDMLSDEEKRVVAYHEAGHALVAHLLPHADPPDKVSIVPRGRALGATEQQPDEERFNLNASYLRDRIGVLLGGRVAEKIVFGEVTTGAENDLKQATQLARRMVEQWGMSEELGPVAYKSNESHPFLGRELAQPRDYSEHTAQVIDDAVRGLVTELEEQAEETLASNRDRLEELANALLEHETVAGEEVRHLLEQPDTEKEKR